MCWPICARHCWAPTVAQPAAANLHTSLVRRPTPPLLQHSLEYMHKHGVVHRDVKVGGALWHVRTSRAAEVPPPR